MKPRNYAQAKQKHNNIQDSECQTDNKASEAILVQKAILSTMQKKKTKLKSRQSNQIRAINTILTQ